MVGPEVRERLLECPAGVVGPVKAVVQLARDEHVATVEARGADPLADPAARCRTSPPCRCAGSRSPSAARPPRPCRRRDLEDAEAELRDRAAVVEFDRGNGGHEARKASASVFQRPFVSMLTNVCFIQARPAGGRGLHRRPRRLHTCAAHRAGALQPGSGGAGVEPFAVPPARAARDQPRPLPMCALAERGRVPLPTASRMLDSLVKRGIATRTRPQDGDRRRVGITLTPEGRRLVAAKRMRIAQAREQVFDHLSRASAGRRAPAALPRRRHRRPSPVTPACRPTSGGSPWS